MKIPAKSALSVLDLTPKKPGNPGAGTPLATMSVDLKSQLAKPEKSHHQQITEQTQKWVSQTFFGTLLKQMGESPFKSELFSGGRGGEAFQGLYNQQLVDHMARASGGKLVNGIVRAIERKETANAASKRSDSDSIRMPEKKGGARPHSDADPRAKAYQRTRGGHGRSNFSMAG